MKSVAEKRNHDHDRTKCLAGISVCFRYRSSHRNNAGHVLRRTIFNLLLIVLFRRMPLIQGSSVTSNDPNEIPLGETFAAASNAATTTKPPSSLQNTILVGQHLYKGPFTDSEMYYPPAVARVLSQYNPQRNIMNQADWYEQLAFAHRSIVEQGDMMAAGNSGGSSSASDLTEHFELSLNAFQQAIQIYQGIKQQQQKNKSNDDDATTKTSMRTQYPSWLVEHHLALAYFQMGETYSLSVKQQDLSQDYFQQAHEMYRRVLQDSTVDVLNRQDIELAWALCSLRLGLSLLEGHDGVVSVTTANPQQSRTQTAAEESSFLAGIEEQMLMHLEQQLQAGATVDYVSLLQDWLAKHPEEAKKLLAEQERQTRKIERVMEYFSSAIDILRRTIRLTHNQSEKLGFTQHLAMGLHHLATAQNLNGDMAAAVKSSEEALSIQENDVLPRLAPDSVEAQETKAAVAQALYNLAGNYLQLGLYEESNSVYSRAMDWYDRCRDILDPHGDTMSLGLTDTQEAVQAFETTLEEYRDLLREQVVGVVEEEIIGEQFYSDKDDGYEADLHSGLASLYVAQGEYLVAESHLTQAIQLYHMVGEGMERGMADAQFNLAVVRFQNKEYVESAQLRKAALDVYKNTVGVGNDPLMQDVQQLDLGILLRHVAPITQEKVGTSQQSTHQSPGEKQQTTASVKADNYETVVDLLDLEEAMVNNSMKDEL